jgi:heterodisulfide reductase subunit C2
MDAAAEVELPVQRPRRLEKAHPLDDMAARAGADLAECLQCGKCSGGCSVAEITEFSPRKIVQMVKMGAEHALLTMDILSCCVGCGLCAERCPVGIDAGAVIDGLRAKAAGRGIPLSRPDVGAFDELFLDSIYRRGRVAEIPLMVRFNLRTGRLLKDADVGWSMFRQGKIGLDLSRVKNKAAVRRLFRREAGR